MENKEEYSEAEELLTLETVNVVVRNCQYADRQTKPELKV